MSTFISSTQSIIAHDHGYRCLQTRYHPRAFLDGASFAPLKRAERDQQPDQISLGRTKTHMCTFTPWPYASHMAILCPRCNSIPHAVDSCLVEAARLRRSGAEWDASFEEAGVEAWGPSDARCVPLVRLLLLLRPRFLVQRHRESPKAVPWAFSAHGGAAGHEQRGVEQHGSPRGQPRAGAVGGQVRPSGAAAAPLRPRFLVQRHWARPGAAPLALFRARQRRWARAAGRGAARQPPWAGEGWGRRRPDAPLWCGCCSSLTLIIGAAALSVA